ncbi:hypothetical protein F2P44_33360 [Massilia sp. CCM 8695]|uniref:Antirepressor protein C-terminal domain-containing protein n=1 Tax=Massilia frigida TaxID=2609281 RepID=A0ABX0NKF5_9BURK|nr:hypothetical protein [Massilia frigida]NHZ84108.1 hypothetical protein [Massilia frigida]
MEVMEQEAAIFESAGQAVHVAFLVMAQEAMQDAPLRMALIRMMESVKLENGQRHWLDQLRGTRSGAVNFGGLTGGEVRAQCAMITQAVKTKLPAVEMWVLQAKFGETEHEDVELGDRQLPATAAPRVTRRFAFSAERIAAIKGLSDYFQPQFPHINPFAMDCMLGRLYANHKKLDISSRDLAAQFGGNHTKYLRASHKLKNQLRILEQQAMARLEPTFIDHGVIEKFH